MPAQYSTLFEKYGITPPENQDQDYGVSPYGQDQQTQRPASLFEKYGIETEEERKKKEELMRLAEEYRKRAEQDKIQQEQNRPGLLGTMMASYQATASSEQAGSSLKEALSGEREQFISPVNAAGQPSQVGVRFLDTGERKQLPADQFNMLSPEGTIQLSKEERQKSLERFKTFSEEAKKYTEEAKRGGENSWFKQTAGDVAGSAKSYLSIPAAAVGSLAGPSGSAMGAVLGGIPAARQAFYTSYGQIAPYLLEQGVDPEKADEIATIYAVRQAGEEYAFELIPGIGKLKFGKNYFTRLASTGIKEAGSEVATELLQNADSYLSEQFADDPKVKSAFRKMNAESESDYVRVASAGLLGATAIGSITTPMELAGERRAAAYDKLKKLLETADPDTQEGAATANQALREAGVEPIADVTEQDTTAQDRGIDVTGPDLMRNPPPIEEAPVSTPTAEKPRVRIVDGEVVPVAPTEAEAQQVTPETTPVTPTVTTPEAETTVEAPQQPVEESSPITGTRKRKVVDDRQQAAEEVSQPLSPEETAAFRTEVAQKLTDMGISEQEAVEIAQADPNPRELVEPVTPQREEAAIKEQRLVPPNPRVQATDKMEVAYDLTNEVENAEILDRLEDSPIIRKTYEQELAKGEQGSVKNVLKAARMDSARTTPYLNNLMTFLETTVDKFNLKLEKTKPDSTALGTFNRLTNAVAFRKASPEAVAHEVTHGVTVALLGDIRAQEANPALKKAVDDINTLYNTVSDVVNTERAKEIKGFSEMRKWMLDYGIKNVKEFVAVGMTNPEFQTLLKQTPDPTKPRRSMWQSLKDFLVKSLKSIGMKAIQGTALDALVDNFSTMMAVSNQNPELVSGAVGRMKERARKEIGLPPVDEMQAPDTEAFKKWFGDSAVVDENGNPLVVYHGTNKNQEGGAFKIFDTYASNYGLMGMGGYFTENPEIASQYTEKGRGDTPTVYPVYLSIKNPLDMGAPANPEQWKTAFDGIENYIDWEGVGDNEHWFRAAEDLLTEENLPKWEGAEIMQEAIRGMGYDGVTHLGGGRRQRDSETHQVWIAFDPEQVKSATGNRGTFNPESSAIDEMSIPSRRATTKKKEENAKKKAATAESKAGFVAPATPASDVKAVGETARTKGDYATEMKRDFQSRKGKAKRYTERLFTSARGIPRDLKEAMDAASFRNTRDTVKAEQYMNKLGTRISKLSEADAKEATRLISLSMEGNKDKQASALAALKRLDPKVHSDFLLWRGVIDKNSVAILREIMAKKVLTDKDAALVRVISNNLGSYLTRTYKATYGEEGKKFAKKRWDKYEAWKNGKQEIDEDVQIVLDGINYLKNQFSIGQFSEVEKMASGEREVSLAELEALHEVWISKDDTKVGPLRSNATEEQKGEYADALIKELLGTKEKMGLDKYEQRLNEQAENAAQGLLGLSNNISKMVELFKGARQDMTILKERKLPKALRELLGEITDPLTQLFATSIAQNSFINKQRMLNEMLEIGKGVYFEEKAKADFDKYSSELTGETLGPLQGYMATPRVAEVLDIYKQTAVNLDAGLALASRPGMESEVAFSAIRSLIKSGVWRTANTWKFAMVIGNAWNWVWAGGSGWLQAVKDGRSPASKHTVYALKAVKDLIGPAYRNYISKEAETALLAGITDSAQVGELTEALRDRIVEQITGKKPGAVKRGLFKLADSFNALDLVWRIAALSAEMDYQKSLAKARGKKLTEEQLVRISGQRVRNRHMNYREAIPAAKLTEKVFLATFLTYFSEVFRSLGNTYAQGFADIKNGTKEGGKAGALQVTEGTRKVLGATAATLGHGSIMKVLGAAGGSVLGAAFDAMSGGDDDDDELRNRLRSDKEKMQAVVDSLATYHKGKMWDVMGTAQRGKQVVLWEPGRLDPYDPANEILRHLMDGDMGKAAASASGLLFGNPGAVSLLNVVTTTGGAVKSAITGEEMDKVKEPSIARQYPETYAALKTALSNTGVPKKVTDTILQSVQIVAPPTLIEGVTAVGAKASGLDQTKKPQGSYWMEATGMQLANINPEYYAKTLKYEVQGEFQKLRKNLKENITPGTSSKALRNEYASAIEKERELANRTKEVVRGMRALGWDTTTIEGVLSESGLSKTKQTEALSGAATITSEVLTKNVLQGIVNDGKMDKVELQTLIDAAGIRGIELEDKKEKGEKKEKSFGGMRGTKWR